MAGFFQNLLTDAAKGFFGSEYLRDYTHASKTFRTNAYGYAPKFKHLFHVYFDINTSLISSTNSWPEDKNFGLAVKSVQLPKYSFDITKMNQYNRKRLIQTKIEYDPISISFHDDNSNLITKLWHTYYTYYYKDAAQIDNTEPNSKVKSASTPNKVFTESRNIYESDYTISGNQDWGYVGEGSKTSASVAAGKGSIKPAFFKSINIFGFNQHNFTRYQLINPIIESFGHDTYSYSENGVMEHTMSLQYETVKYYEGAIDGKNPSKIVKEFADESHYDRRLSPIARPGSNASILGQGGLVDSAGGIMEDIANGNYIGAIRTAGAAANTFKNPANILKIASSEAVGVAGDYVTGSINRNTIAEFNAAASSGVKTIANTTSNVMKNAPEAVQSAVQNVTNTASQISRKIF